MNREELKQLWFNMDYSNVKERKEVLVETKSGQVTITREGPNGISEFKTNQGDNALQYALDCEEYRSSKYELIVI